MNKDELESRSGVAARNIRFLIAQGMLPPPDGAGRASSYSDTHLRMLQTYRTLKDEGLYTLDYIAGRMKAELDPYPRIERLTVFDGLVIEADLEGMKEMGVEQVLARIRETLEAKLEASKENVDEQD